MMITLLATIAALASAAPAPSTLLNPLAKQQVVLQHSDLDLATADGQSRLTSRLREAAIDLCGARMQAIHLTLVSKSQRCQAEVIAEARGRIEELATRDSGAAYAAMDPAGAGGQ